MMEEIVNETVNQSLSDVMLNNSGVLQNTTQTLTGQDVGFFDSIFNGFLGLDLPIQAVSIIGILLFALWLFWWVKSWVSRIGQLMTYIAIAIVIVIILILVFASPVLQELLSFGG